MVFSSKRRIVHHVSLPRGVLSICANIHAKPHPSIAWNCACSLLEKILVKRNPHRWSGHFAENLHDTLPAFVLDNQHGRHSVTCKPAIQVHNV